MNAAQRIVSKLGGRLVVSRELGHKHPTTVQGWEERGIIPARQQKNLLELARKRKVRITANDFFWVPREEAKAA